MKDISVKDAKKLMLKKNESSDVLSVFNVFISSINDWPKNVKTFCEYEKEIEIFIEDVTTLHNISDHLKSIDLKYNPWESESLFQIMEVFQFYKRGITLKEIICVLSTGLEKEG